MIRALSGVLALASLSAIPSLLTTPQAPPECAGEFCGAEVIVLAGTNVTMSVYSLEDGSSINLGNCGPCASCKATVTFDYTGIDTWHIGITDVRGQVGDGPTSGSWNMQTPCDGIPPNHFIDAEDSSSAQLYCLCQP